MDDLDLQEVLCGFYKTTSTTSEEVFEILNDVLFRFQLPVDEYKGQSYDGAANVSGHVNRITQEVDS